jgi:hypothetical protein
MIVNIEQVITRTKLRLGLMDTTLADAYLEKLIDEGARHLDALSTYIINCESLTIDCNKAELPSDIRSEQDIICMKFNNNGSCCGACSATNNGVPNATITNINNSLCGCWDWWIPNRNVLTNFCGQGANAYYCGNIFDVQGGYIHFPSYVTATEIAIYYRGYNTDKNGLMIIDEKKERALSAYAAYEYATSGSNIKYYDKYQIAKWNSLWKAQKNWLRGSDVVDDHRLHKGEFSAIARAILVNPLIAFDRNV